MGTYYRIKVVDDSSCQIQQESVSRFLSLFNQSMSTYIKLSEISQFNQAPANKAIPVSPFLEKALLMSKAVWRDTRGAFDPTIGPVVNLWGFGPMKESKKIPTSDDIVQQMRRVGMSKLGLEGSRAYRMADIYVDLSGIAKGFAVDSIASLLEENSYEDYLIEIGGELKVGGKNREGRLWSIAVEKPEVLKRSIFRALPLKSLAMATSGDYRNYREIDGQRYSHLIDPRTGMPITHKLVSVTVLHPSTALTSIKQ